MNKKTVIIVLVALVLGLVVGYVVAPKGNSFGAVVAADVTTITNPWVFSKAVSFSGTAATLKVGSNGSTMSEIKATAATIAGTTDTSHTASTTKYYYAAVTGVASGDVVFAQLATSSPGFANSFGLGWAITAAKASTTAGYVDLMVANFSGQSIAPSASGGFGSTTNIFYIDN